MILAITQARLSSSRFPGKVLADVGGMTMLELHLKRIRKSKMINEVVVALADEPGAEELERKIAEMDVRVWRGPVNDVLARFAIVVDDVKPQTVVRLTSDCPLIDPDIIDAVISLHQRSGADYTSNIKPPTYPDGFDVEVVKASLLLSAHVEATHQRDREHVMPFFWSQPDKFKLANLSHAVDDSDLRLTVDYPGDLSIISYLVQKLGFDAKYDDIVSFVRTNPTLTATNSMFERNEALKK